MLAGEGLGGVLQALLAVAKVDGGRECSSLSPSIQIWQNEMRIVLTLRWCSVRDGDWMPRVRVLRMKNRRCLLRELEFAVVSRLLFALDFVM